VQGVREIGPNLPKSLKVRMIKDLHMAELPR